MSSRVAAARLAVAALVLSALPLRAQDRPLGVLAPTIAPLLGGRVWRHATWGALVVSLTRGDTLFSLRADRRFLPASNAKLFTTAAALHYLGADFRFVTVLFGNGPVRDSTRAATARRAAATRDDMPHLKPPHRRGQPSACGAPGFRAASGATRRAASCSGSPCSRWHCDRRAAAGSRARSRPRTNQGCCRRRRE